MPHRRRSLLRTLHPRLSLVAALTLACSGGDRADVTPDGAGVEVPSPVPAPRAAAGASADSLARLRALADSASSLDSRFQAERARLNDEAAALSTLDRRAPEYARRWDAHRRGIIAAESLRAQRDRLRANERALRDRLATQRDAP